MLVAAASQESTRNWDWAAVKLQSKLIAKIITNNAYKINFQTILRGNFIMYWIQCERHSGPLTYEWINGGKKEERNRGRVGGREEARKGITNLPSPFISLRLWTSFFFFPFLPQILIELLPVSWVYTNVQRRIGHASMGHLLQNKDAHKQTR